MSVFQAVNNTELTTENPRHPVEVTTPTTPKPPSASIAATTSSTTNDESSPNTPTRNSFAGVPGQRPLPTSSTFGSSHDKDCPAAPASAGGKSNSREGSSHRSAESPDSHDVDMDDMDDGEEGSDGESIAEDGTKSSKKKKGQRFFCTDFPPCTLSFTRSEHLARHIRKHTGERPFQCHCSRRFSRLDNLRQHAQTVHVNEEIPGDSLAATGTRFQRQVRTDRVRPPGTNRSRASTGGSNGSLGRSHSRNLSTSSITSTISNFSQREDARRRPAPLMMATDSPSRARLTLDTFRPSPESPSRQETQYRGYPPQPSSGLSTPTSATFSTGPGSPRFGSSVQSPNGNIPRSAVFWSRGHERRLSVPSGTSPFRSPASGFPPPYMSPMASSSGSTFSGNSSLLASPTSSTYSGSTYEPNAFAAREATYKRQTWHPETQSSVQRRMAHGGPRFHNSSHASALAASHTPVAVPQETRLPGIESFDPGFQRPQTPPRRIPSPMQIDTPSRAPVFGAPADQASVGPDNRRGVAEWDMSLHRNLTRLDITSTPPAEQRPPSWHSQASVGSESGQRPVTAPYGAVGSSPQSFQSHPQGQIIHQQAQTRPADATSPTMLSPETPRKKKRQGWYAGPIQAHQFPPVQAQAQPPAAQPAHGYSHPPSHSHSLSQPTLPTQIQTHVQHVPPQPSQHHHHHQRTSPEDSSSSEGVPTPSTSSIAEYHPSIVHSSGWPDDPQQGYQHSGEAAHHNQRPVADSESGPPKRDDADMLRMEVLVAVATSEDKATK